MRAFLLLRLLLFVVSFRCQVSPTGPTRITWKQSVLQLHKGKPLTQTTLMKWFPFQSDCATPASGWLPARYPLEIQGTDQPAGTDCDSRDCGRLLFFLCLSDQNAAQNLCSEINFLSLHHRRVLCTLCIIKYVHSFKKKKNSFPMEAGNAFVWNANELRFHIPLPARICIYTTQTQTVFIVFLPWN